MGHSQERAPSSLSERKPPRQNAVYFVILSPEGAEESRFSAVKWDLMARFFVAPAALPPSFLRMTTLSDRLLVLASEGYK